MEDEKIVGLLYEHNDDGLKAVKEKYENFLVSFSKQIVNNEDDALECVNDVYMKLWDTIPPYKPTYLKSFILKITRQISIDKYRYNHRKTKDNNNVTYLSDLDFEVKDNRNVESEVQERLFVSKINEFIETLDTTTQILFIRRYFFFETTKSLSEKFKISETNINVKMLRVKKNLKKFLEREGYIIENN